MIVQTVYPGDVLIWPRNDNAAYLDIDAIAFVRFAKAIVRGRLIRKDRVEGYRYAQLYRSDMSPILTSNIVRRSFRN